MLHDIPNLVIKPHLTTTNIYARKGIILENLQNIADFLNFRKGANIKTAVYFNVCQIRNEQTKQLNIVNRKIAEVEQGSFAFGNPFTTP